LQAGYAGNGEDNGEAEKWVIKSFALVVADSVQINLGFGNTILRLAEHLAHDRVYPFKINTHILSTLCTGIQPFFPTTAPDFTHAAVSQMHTIFKAANAIDTLRQNLHAKELRLFRCVLPPEFIIVIYRGDVCRTF
jgi:hypothetical protein